MKFPNIGNIKSMEKKYENVHRVRAPYYLTNSRPVEYRNKVIFFGCDFNNISSDSNLQQFIALTNQCLDFIRRECRGLDLYYKPHPVEKDEYRLLDLSGFKIETDRAIGEWFLYKNSEQIKYVFSHFSTVSVSAYGLGLNSYIFFPVLRDVLGTVAGEGYERFLSVMPDSFYISDLNKKLEENRFKLDSDEFLETQWKLILDEHAGTIWFMLDDPGFLPLAASFAKLIKHLAPDRKAGILIMRHERWDLINVEELGLDFDQIVFFPLIIYSLRPRRLFAICKVVISVLRFDINSSDIFFALGPNTFLSNCFMSYYKRNFRIGLIRENDFKTNYLFSYPLKDEDYQIKWSSLFYYKVIEPVLRLYPGIRRLGMPGNMGASTISRFQGLLNELFNLTYIIINDGKTNNK